jgi:hypothetical protein
MLPPRKIVAEAGTSYVESETVAVLPMFECLLFVL